MKKLFILLTFLFTVGGLAEAKPRFPFPKTPDEIGQNDRDLSDDISAIEISSNSLPSGSTEYLQNRATTGTTQTGAVGNVSSMTVAGQFTVGQATGAYFQVFTDGEARFISKNINVNNAVGTLRLRSGDANRVIRFNGGVSVDPIIYVPLNSDTLITGYTTGVTFTTRTAITQTGVGINTDTPATELHILDTVNDAALRIEASAVGSSPLVRFVNRGQLTLFPEVGLENTTGGGGGRYGSPANSLNIVTISTHAVIIQTNLIPRWKADENGYITQATQPSFLVTNSTGSVDITGDGTNWKASFGNEIFDRADNWSPTTNTFTAPVTGVYGLCASMMTDNLLTTHTGRQFRITTSNRLHIYEEDQASGTAFTNKSWSFCVYADVDVNDTVTVNVLMSGGTKTVDINASAVYNTFSGSLIN